MDSKGCVVLVTGGSGFLGQHVVGLLQERADHVTGIRVLDVIPYKNKLDYAERLPVQQYVGSVTDKDLVQRACKGVDCVMHVASIVDTSLIPDEDLSYKINVAGTKNVIAGCRKNGVKRLLYCSTVEVVTGTGNIYDGTEDNTEYATSHLFKAYGSTKVEAERLVLEANCSELKTLALRPAVMYGELEWRSLGRHATGFLAQKMGRYVRLDCKNGLVEHVYVGNVAWGFVSAENNFHEGRIQQGSTGCGYFIVDDSPRTNLSAFMDNILLEIGLKPFALTLPIWIFVFPLYILYLLLSLISIVHRVNFFVGIIPFMSLHRICLFRYEKASKYLGYKPLYSYDEAKQRTVKFFQSCLSTRS
ncbi:3 beta-hydroxysteroid dehydrogenase/Delta 5--_4-isomerase type 4-like isoform X2 [Mercenaria mercenaria]|uniref:3 beta-hydroxysteroid dehydrogenase/Delta 5-->4-isomerase type 4-like isoform X2 n=1 Tax=Mercenaria mercenaria TaxID=6596 RepID=UPI00234F3B1A|nr:3 beta-hydroxysteroid dehydrogenase/Delta 5-->4-isomerase type 4-like isoform X2 [Mercenaria mercenaria]